MGRVAGSAHMPVRGPVDLNAMSPTASAIRYGATGLSILYSNVQRSAVQVLPAASATRSPLITAVSCRGTAILASQVWRMPGESCVGIQLRLRIASPWLNRKGCFLPAVCAGVSHWSAFASGDEA